MVKGETYNKQLFESEAFRHFINVFTNKESGVTRGCEITKDTQNIIVGEGYFFIQGGLLRETTGTANAIPNEAGYYKLVYEIDLSKTNAKDVFNQGGYKFIKALGDYPSLTQEDLDNEGTIYQLPFAQFRITEEGLQDFEDIRPTINYGIYEKKGTVLYEDEEGTNGDITLNDTVENYDEIEIFFDNDRNSGNGEQIFNNAKVMKPNGKYVTLEATKSGTVYTYKDGQEYQILENKLNVVHFYNLVFSNDSVTTSIDYQGFIRVFKIIGYKN